MRSTIFCELRPSFWEVFLGSFSGNSLNRTIFLRAFESHGEERIALKFGRFQFCRLEETRDTRYARSDSLGLVHAVKEVC